LPPSFFIVAKALLSVDFGEDPLTGLGLEVDPCGPENVEDRTGCDFGFDGLGLCDFTGVTGCDTGDFGGGGLEAEGGGGGALRFGLIGPSCASPTVATLSLSTGLKGTLSD